MRTTGKVASALTEAASVSSADPARPTMGSKNVNIEAAHIHRRVYLRRMLFSLKNHAASCETKQPMEKPVMIPWRCLAPKEPALVGDLGLPPHSSTTPYYPSIWALYHDTISCVSR